MARNDVSLIQEGEGNTSKIVRSIRLNFPSWKKGYVENRITIERGNLCFLLAIGEITREEANASWIYSSSRSNFHATYRISWRDAYFRFPSRKNCHRRANLTVTTRVTILSFDILDSEIHGFRTGNEVKSEEDEIRE